MGIARNAPSVGAICYQLLTLKEHLLSFGKEDYPVQTRQIRDVFLSLTDRIGQELKKILEIEAATPDQVDIDRALKLGSLIYKIYAFIRYLKASSPQQSPPGIQLALGELTRHFFPKTNGTPVCLVRPQWSYNLGYVDLSAELEDMIELNLLNPQNDPAISDKKDLLPALWKRQREDQSAPTKEAEIYPNQLAVLSFAALDTNDVLLYPILAHELGHFIDFSFRPNYLHLKKDLYTAAEITVDSIKTTLLVDQDKAEELYELLLQHAGVCLREIIADLLAVRMMGFSFFVAQAEYLKAVSAWPGKIIEPSGYPGLKFRLSIVHDYLKSLPEDHSVYNFLNQHKEKEPSASFLLTYLNDWAEILENGSELRTKKEIKGSPQRFLENAIRSALTPVYSIINEVMSNCPCAKLSKSFFSRVDNLRHDLPPSCEVEDENSFSEIFSAAWAYQLQFGEDEERRRNEVEKKRFEYDKTCNLVLKSIELIPFGSEETQTSTGERATRVPEPKPEFFDQPHGVLGKKCLAERIALPVSDRSSIKLIPFNPRSLRTVSIDLRLGNWFSVARKTRLSCFRIASESPEEVTMFARELTFTPHRQRFVIHPGDLVLGTTLEFVALPGNVMAYVEGKSKVGRKGLIIATASKIDPGFHGVIVLELVNAGTVPIEIEPGSVVAQLIFQGLRVPLEESDFYRGEYYCQIKPH